MVQLTTFLSILSSVLLAVGAISGRIAAQEEDLFPEAVPRSRQRQPNQNEGRRPISLDGGASINPELLEDVKDNTIGLTHADREAYFRILKLTEKLDATELRTLALEFKEDRYNAIKRYRHRPIEKFPSFVDLFQHPEDYRGRPVTLHGKLRRLVTSSAGENDQQFQDLHEGWFFADEGQGNPAVIIFTEKPDGFPGGGDIEEEVSVTGYFLKMYGYSAQDTTRRAPLILARTIRWHQQQAPVRWSPAPQTYLAFSAGILVIALLIALMVRESQLKTAAWKASRRPHPDVFVPFDESSTQQITEPSRNGATIEPHH